jgi:deoxyribodipyrimidine photo-lyase
MFASYFSIPSAQKQSMKTLFWFRRDRRLQDNEALIAAASQSTELFPFYVFPNNLSSLTPLRQASIIESVRSLDNSIPSGINTSFGNAAEAIAKFVTENNIENVFATRSFDTEGMAEQEEVFQKLSKMSVPLVLVGSYYAIQPGTVRKDDGSPLRVYTPFYKRWVTHDWGSPLKLDVSDVSWCASNKSVLPKVEGSTPFQVRASEAYALETWDRFKSRALSSYHEHRNRTDLSGTSNLSHALAHGEIHPRTLLAELGDSAGEEIFRKELAWREFYADVLFHNPHTLTDYYEPRFSKMRYESPANSATFAAWKAGKTGYPIVDAAMRQLVQSGWMHNRSRMIVASFLVKDLHIEWQHGARFFEEHLTDFDPASNAHGWQWTAGCGTDASPYYRIFNPILQGVKFDPNGDYVRRWVPELRHIEDSSVHEPWKLIDGYSQGYAERIVDHDTERAESLARLEEIKTKS